MPATLAEATRNQKRYPSREAWLAARQSGLGASEAPAALGVSPWQSPLDLWMLKTGHAAAPDLDSVPAVYWGGRLEPAIRAEAKRRFGQAIHNPGRYTIQRAEAPPFLFATLDGIVADSSPDVLRLFADAELPQPHGPGTLQIKTTNAYRAEDWNDAAGWPVYYQAQTQAELQVTGCGWGVLAILIGGQDFRLFPFARHDAFIAAMLPRLEAFWQCVESGTAPEPDASEATRAALAKMYPADDGTSIELPAAADGWADQIAQAKAAAKAADAMKREAENHLRAAIGEATYGVTPLGRRFSLKAQTRREHMVPESTFRVLRETQ